MIEITRQPISPEVVINRAKSARSGCVVTYVGLIREYSQGKPVLSVEYEDVEERNVGPKVQLVVQGDILDSDQTSNRILDLLNKNFSDSNGSFNNASFAW